MVEGGLIPLRLVRLRPAIEALHLVAAPLLQHRGLILGLSTPSAVMVTCNDWPRPTMLDTMALVCGLTPSVSMKEWSILIDEPESG